MTYVDGFVFPVSKKNFQAYKKMASSASKIWKKFGALQYFECCGDDLIPSSEGMKVRTFIQLAKPKPGEQVWFSFIIYKSKAHRNQVNKRVMDYFKKKYKEDQHQDMPFDARRMAYGGFKTIVQE